MAGKFAGFTEKDVLFLVEAIDPGLVAKVDTIRGDPSLIEGMLEQESDRVFQRMMLLGEEQMAMVSPRFFFEVLLRRALSELRSQSYTVERTATQRIPVFDTGEVVRFLDSRAVLKYLAGMLASFTKVESFTLPVRIRKGMWRKIRFSDMDIDGLARLCESLEEEQRFRLYKRIADLCLFILGMFPESMLSEREYALGAGQGQLPVRRRRRSAEELEEEGRLFYKLAGEHYDAAVLEQADVLRQLHEKFNLARKPLNYVSDNYLKFRKRNMFPSASTG